MPYLGENCELKIACTGRKMLCICRAFLYIGKKENLEKWEETEVKKREMCVVSAEQYVL